MTLNFQDLILNLSRFWSEYGCIIQQPYDIEKGASTMNPATFLRALGPEPWQTAMVEPCRRPTDARYGENPNRLGHYFQYQVILKPSPDNAQELYLKRYNLGGNTSNIISPNQNIIFNIKKQDIKKVNNILINAKDMSPNTIYSPKRQRKQCAI